MKYVIDGSTVNSLSDFMWDIIYLINTRRADPSLELISTRNSIRPNKFNPENLDSLNDYVNRELTYDVSLNRSKRVYKPFEATLVITDSEHLKESLNRERDQFLEYVKSTESEQENKYIPRGSHFRDILDIFKMNPYLTVDLQ